MTVQNYLQQFADRPQTVILQENDEKMKWHHFILTKVEHEHKTQSLDLWKK